MHGDPTTAFVVGVMPEAEAGWRRISPNEVEIGEQIGGGGVALVYSGWFGNDQVRASRGHLKGGRARDGTPA